MVNSRNDVNTIHPTFAKQLGLLIRPTDVGTQKINGTALDTHKIIVAGFLVVDKANRVKFFEETFLMANISPKVVFEIPFFILRGADVDFSGQELR